MKSSLFSNIPYSSPEVDAIGTWPCPAGAYDPAVGLKTLANTIAAARLADELGFDWVSASEHHYWPTCPTPAPALLLAALSQVIKHAQIAYMGPLVSLNNPIRVAEEVATLDQLSGGRLMVLFLRGTPNEFLAYNVAPEETRERTQEAISLIEKALTEPQPFSWEGRYFRYRTVSVWPGPTQRPLPRIISSGNSFDSATFAAQHHYDMGMSFYPTESCAKLVDFYRSECARFGWEPTGDQLLHRCYVCVGESDEHASELASHFFERGVSMSAPYHGRGTLVLNERKKDLPKLPAAPDDPGQRANAQGFGLGRLQFVGSAPTVIEQITDFYKATGVGTIDCGFNGGGLSHEEAMDSIRRFGKQVMPIIRELDSSATDDEALSGVR